MRSPCRSCSGAKRSARCERSAPRAGRSLRFALEGALFGTAGSLAGVLLGAYLARFSVQAVAKTVVDLVRGHARRSRRLRPIGLLRAFLIGVVLATASAAIPAFIAAAHAAGKRSARPGFGAAHRERRCYGGFSRRSSLFGVAALAARLPALDGIPVFGYVAGLACIVGGAACVLPGLVAFARLASRAGAARAAAGRVWPRGISEAARDGRASRSHR